MSDLVQELQSYFKDGDSTLIQKTVIGNIPHTCALCSKSIPAGTESISVKKAFAKAGWQRCWFCTDCCRVWAAKLRKLNSSQETLDKSI